MFSPYRERPGGRFRCQHGEMERQLALPHLSDAKGEHPEVTQRLIMQHKPLRNATAIRTLNL
jgi:hypothetical protein